MREQYRKLHKALPGVDLHYALKPLPHPAVVQTIVDLGGWLDLATTGETQLVTQLGIDPARCIHTHPIKRDIDIRNALHLGVKIFVADNPDEVRKFDPYGQRECCCAVVSPPGAVGDLAKKFGCDPEDLSNSRGSPASWACRCVGSRSTLDRRERCRQTRRGHPSLRQAHRRPPTRKTGGSTCSTSAAASPPSTHRRPPTSGASARPSARRWPALPRKLRIIAEPGR